MIQPFSSQPVTLLIDEVGFEFAAISIISESSLPERAVIKIQPPKRYCITVCNSQPSPNRG